MSAALAIEVGLLALSVPVVGCAVYLLVLAVLSLPSLRGAADAGGPGALDRPDAPGLRFALVVPAHDEAAGISATVGSLLGVEYPAPLRRVLVVADNCSDDTASRARAAGAEVLERVDPDHRGKGHALAHAFANCLTRGDVDAVVVVDADTIVSSNLLTAFAARLAAGEVAVQAQYGVRNPEASWRTRLMRLALAMFHQVRSSGRERLGVSCGLRGNGMCFKSSLLREVPHDAFSLVEDLEYGLRLGEAGHRVAYAGEAAVLGEMVAGEQASRSQRARWEGGRAEMLARFGWPLLRRALRQRSPLLLDLALDVLVPPLSRLVLWSLGGLLAALVLRWLGGAGLGAAAVYAFSLASLGVYVTAGWLHSGTGWRGLRDLLFAPAYVLWKLSLRAKRGATSSSGEWVRTARERETR